MKAKGIKFDRRGYPISPPPDPKPSSNARNDSSMHNTGAYHLQDAQIPTYPLSGNARSSTLGYVHSPRLYVNSVRDPPKTMRASESSHLPNHPIPTFPPKSSQVLYAPQPLLVGQPSYTMHSSNSPQAIGANPPLSAHSTSIYGTLYPYTQLQHYQLAPHTLPDPVPTHQSQAYYHTTYPVSGIMCSILHPVVPSSIPEAQSISNVPNSASNKSGGSVASLSGRQVPSIGAHHTSTGAIDKTSSPMSSSLDRLSLLLSAGRAIEGVSGMMTEKDKKVERDSGLTIGKNEDIEVGCSLVTETDQDIPQSGTEKGLVPVSSLLNN